MCYGTASGFGFTKLDLLLFQCEKMLPRRPDRTKSIIHRSEICGCSTCATHFSILYAGVREGNFKFWRQRRDSLRWFLQSCAWSEKHLLLHTLAHWPFYLCFLFNFNPQTGWRKAIGRQKVVLFGEPLFPKVSSISSTERNDLSQFPECPPHFGRKQRHWPSIPTHRISFLKTFFTFLHVLPKLAPSNSILVIFKGLLAQCRGASILHSRSNSGKERRQGKRKRHTSLGILGLAAPRCFPPLPLTWV